MYRSISHDLKIGILTTGSQNFKWECNVISFLEDHSDCCVLEEQVKKAEKNVQRFIPSAQARIEKQG